MTADELLKRIDAGNAPQVIDVRSAVEYRYAHIPGAVSIPFYKMSTLRRQVGSNSEPPAILCCEHGPRAWLAIALLRLYGEAGVECLAGHMHGWKSRGFPVERE